MEKINLNEKEIYNIIKSNNFTCESGGFGSVFKYKDGLGLKFSAGLFNLNGFDKEYFESHKNELYVNEKQIELLVSKQNKVKLTSLPKGVAYYNGVPIAVILEYFENHKSFYNLMYEHYTAIISVFYKFVDIINELVDNGIYQLDVKESNFLYSSLDYSAKAIDLDGPLVKCLSNERYSKSVYNCFYKMICNMVKTKISYDISNNLIDFNEAKRRICILDEYSKGIHNADALEFLIDFINNFYILDYKKKVR